MQGRVGPRLLQPYYDLRKLLVKEQATVNAVDEAYVTCGLIFVVLAGGLFISGSNLLMCVFLVTLGTLFVIVAAYSSRSPYSDTGADRECLQVMSYEPMLLIMTVGFFTATQSFDIASLTTLESPIICVLVPIFIGLLFILTIKLRKSRSTLLQSSRAPGDRQGHHHRDERPYARHRGRDALVRERVVPHVGWHVLHLG